MFRKLAYGAAAASLLAASASFAETSATAATDLNLRAGPGPFYNIMGVIASGDSVAVLGCLENVSWCKVDYNGAEGWASGDYLTAKIGDNTAVLYENRQKVQVATVTYENTTDASAIAGASAGAIAGTLIGGPVGGVIGTIVGTGMGVAADPGPQVMTYVTANPVTPIYLDGEVVVGAGIPDTVEVIRIPDSEFGYLYVNGVPVIVESGNRRIVHIVR